jgi:hypothetical protein
VFVAEIIHPTLHLVHRALRQVQAVATGTARRCAAPRAMCPAPPNAPLYLHCYVFTAQLTRLWAAAAHARLVCVKPAYDAFIFGYARAIFSFSLILSVDHRLQMFHSPATSRIKKNTKVKKASKTYKV